MSLRVLNVAAMVVLWAGAVQAQTPKRIALVGGMLLDGYEVPPLHHAAVLIEGNQIVQVGPASEVKIPPDATVIDTSGRTMMPGMIELHAHLVIVGHGDYSAGSSGWKTTKTNIRSRRSWSSRRSSC